MDAEEQFITLTKMKNWELEGEEGDAMLTIRPDLVRHLCRNDLTSPEIHVCGRQPASREVMKFLEAESVLSYFLPSKNDVPDGIPPPLPLRQRTSAPCITILCKLRLRPEYITAEIRNTQQRL